MLYFFIGNKRTKLHQEVMSLRDGLLKKKPNATFVRYVPDRFDRGLFESHLYEQGLFNSAFIVYGDGLFSSGDLRKDLVGLLPDMAISHNVFIFLEERLDALTKKKAEKVAKKIVYADDEKNEGEIKKGQQNFNPFVIADAFTARDVKKLFLLFHQALREDVSSEELSGMLFSSVRHMRVAAQVTTAAEAGMKPYPFQKAQAGLRVWSVESLEKSSRDLVALYHQAHRGDRDFTLGLERFILTLA